MSYWDEMIAVGATIELGSHPFTAEDIKAFAAKYDPQAFHLDEAAASASLLGGLCASGWHTAAVFMRFNVEAMQASVARWAAAGQAIPEIGPSPGFRNLRWPRPVYAGETVAFRQTITGKRVSTSRPGWGIVETANEGVETGSGRTVFGFDGSGFIGLT